MVMCKVKDCGQEFDVEFYHGQPEKIVECHFCNAPHKLSWEQPVPGVYVNFRCELVSPSHKTDGHPNA